MYGYAVGRDRRSELYFQQTGTEKVKVRAARATKRSINASPRNVDKLNFTPFGRPCKQLYMFS